MNEFEKPGLQPAAALLARADRAGYRPPGSKFNTELDRDLMPLLMLPESTALVAVDMQNLFTDPASPMAPPEGPEIAVKINRLADYCRGMRIPIIWTQQTSRPDGSDLGIMADYWPTLRPPVSSLARGSHGWELYPGLKVLPSDIIVCKPKYNAFWGSDLEAVLRGLHIKSVIFAGIACDVCVMTTLIDAFHRDFNPILALDATGSPFPDLERLLWHIETFWGRVLTIDEIIIEADALAAGGGSNITN